MTYASFGKLKSSTDYFSGSMNLINLEKILLSIVFQSAPRGHFCPI